MPDFRLPTPEYGENMSDTVDNFYDTLIKFRKELQFLLANLDDQNIVSINADTVNGLTQKIQTLIADLVIADVVVSNTVVTNVLCAEKGYISELTVDELDTSVKVQKFLASDTSDVNYIKIKEQRFQFITATYANDTEQAKDRYGHNMYWLDASKAAVTQTNTGIPVLVYKYTEYIKAQLYFDDSTPRVPVIEMGTGDGVLPLSAKGFIKKSQTGISIEYYKSNTADKVSLELTDDGPYINGTGIWRGTAAQYNAISTKDSNTLYFISG